MIRHRLNINKLFTATCRLFVCTVFMLMLSVPLPAYAETQNIPDSKPVQEESETVKTEPGPVLITQIAHPHRITGEYVKGYFTDTGRILASPTDWEGYDWLKAGLVAGVTSGLILADADIKSFTQKNQSKVGNNFASVGNALGNPLYTVPTLALLYVYYHIKDDTKARRTSLLAVESLAISGVFVGTIKYTAQRPRPYAQKEPTEWNGPSFKGGDYSFPSNHTAAAFSIASVIAEEYGTNPYVPPIAYGLATLTGFARLYDNKHWASDAFLGGAIGYFTGKAVVRYHTMKVDAPLKIQPTVSQQGFGVMAEYRF